MFGSKIARSQFFKREDDTFIFSNNALNPEVYGILASNWAYSSPLFFGLKVPIVLGASNQQDYNQLVFDKEMTPKKIKGIRLLFESFDANQFSNPFQWVSLDSDGSYKTFVDHPINLLALDQYQDRLVDIYYDNLVIGGNQLLLYKINGQTKVSMTFIYDDFRLENLLDKDSPRQVIYSKPDIDRFEYLL